MSDQSQVLVSKSVDATLRFTEIIKKHESLGPEASAEKAFDELKEELGISEGELAYALELGFKFADKLQELDADAPVTP